MKKTLLVLILTLSLSLFLAVASADEPLPLRDFVEQILAPMAKANDYEWRIVQEFSNEELGALIEACEANGITLPEDSYLMKHYRDGETYYEESAISVVCEAVFGVDFWEWRIADRQWLREVMEGLGYDDWEQEEVPGPDDLTEDEARTILFAALHENYGDDIPFENSEYFRITLSFEPDQEWDEDGTRWEDGWSWELDCRRREDGQQFLAHMDHAGQNVVTFMLKNNSLLKNESYSTGETSLEEYSLTEEEAIHLAAEAIRDQTGVDAPLEDPEFYQASARELTATADGTLYWDVFFPSCSKEWGYCRATVEDVSRVVRVKTTDVGPTTVDNILDRYQNEYGFWGYWPLETWVQLSEEKEGLPAVSFEARILGNTRYILPREGLLSQLEADEIAFRTAGLTRASIYCMVLIDADPHPVWKFCLETQQGIYVLGWTLIEVDAVTGEVLYQGPWLHDEDVSCRVYSLNSTWAKLTLAEEGPLPLASLAVHHTYNDRMSYVEFYLDDENYWKPIIRGLNVEFEGQKQSFPNFKVRLDENGIPDSIMVSVQMDEIQYAMVDLGEFSAGDCPVDMSGVVEPEDIQSFREWESIVDTGETILARCKDKWGSVKDYSLLSITQFRPDHIWLFEYNIMDDPNAYEAWLGGGLYVAVDSQSRTIVQAWVEE